MNRFVQKLIAGAAAVAIAVTGLLGGAPVAKAVEPTQPTEGTITITNSSDANYAHTFAGWRLATLKGVKVADSGNSIEFTTDTTDAYVADIETVMGQMTSETVDGKPIKATYEADNNYNSSAHGGANPMGFLIDKVFKNANKTTTVEDSADGWMNSSSALREFATLLAKKSLSTDSANDYNATFKSGDAPNKSVENSCKQGFWFLVDTTVKPGDDDANKDTIESQSIPMLLATRLVNPTGQNIPDYAGATASLGTVTLKANEPSISKEITKVNDVNADSKIRTDARIGDTITYTLTTTIPNYTGYNDGSRVLQLIDTAAHGLKDVTVTKVMVGNTELTADADANTDNNGYVLTKLEKQTDPLDGCSEEDATVTTVDLGHYVNSNGSIAPGATVTVTLTAVVDSDAVIAGVGNPNTVELVYSRTPSGEEHRVPGPTVRVYTYDFSIHKTNMAGNEALPGAQFAIARVNANNPETFMKVDTNGMWSDATNDDLTGGKPTVGGAAAFTTKADGNISMKGLPAGTYHVYEIKAPDGYTSIGLPDFTFTIGSTIDDGTKAAIVIYTKATNTDDRIAFDNTTASQANVKNAKNLTELPMTGDLGIKVFVTVGVLLMAAGAAFALSARMRS